MLKCQQAAEKFEAWQSQEVLRTDGEEILSISLPIFSISCGRLFRGYGIERYILFSRGKIVPLKDILFFWCFVFWIFRSAFNKRRVLFHA